MTIEKFRVSNDENIYEAWPDIVQTDSGKLIAIFTECLHHTDRGKSRIVISESTDRGRTWSEKKPFTEIGVKTNFFNCARISKLNDGTLAVICDKVIGDEHSGAEIYIWFGDKEGTHWKEPLILPFCAIVPDKLLQLKSGRLIVCAHFGNKNSRMVEQYLWYSDDLGKTWSDKIIVAADARYNLCEASVLECNDGTLVAFMRENSNRCYDCFKAISYDSGETWQGVFEIPIPCCHRPVAGFLKDGRVLMTYRMCQAGTCWTQNTFMAFFTEEDAKKILRNEQGTRLAPLDYDRNVYPDTGYTGWTQFDDGEVYIINYIKDDAQKAQIRGYSVNVDEYVL